MDWPPCPLRSQRIERARHCALMAHSDSSAIFFLVNHQPTEGPLNSVMERVQWPSPHTAMRTAVLPGRSGP